MKKLVIGVGNQTRGDDAIGIHIANRMNRSRLPDVDITISAGEAASLMDLWKDADSVVLIDAVQSGASPGTVFRIDPRVHGMPSTVFHYSTHDLGVVEAVMLSAAMGQLPRHFVIYGIEGKTFEHGGDITPRVLSAADRVEELVTQELSRLTSKRLDQETANPHSL